MHLSAADVCRSRHASASRRSVRFHPLTCHEIFPSPREFVWARWMNGFFLLPARRMLDGLPLLVSSSDNANPIHFLSTLPAALKRCSLRGRRSRSARQTLGCAFPRREAWLHATQQSGQLLRTLKIQKIVAPFRILGCSKFNEYSSSVFEYWI